MLFVRRPARAAFSLIEVAIVLGVIGLVLGGIWAAAASLTAKKKLNDTGEGVMVALQTVRQLYNGQECTAALFAPWNVGLGPISTWPPYTGGGTTQVITPLGPPMQVLVQCGGTYGDAIVLSFAQGTWDFTPDMCRKLNIMLGLKNATGTPTADANFIALGGTGSCPAVPSGLSYYFRLY